MLQRVRDIDGLGNERWLIYDENRKLLAEFHGEQGDYNSRAFIHIPGMVRSLEKAKVFYKQVFDFVDKHDRDNADLWDGQEKGPDRKDYDKLCKVLFEVVDEICL